jgi:hypothetical protein
MADFKVFPLISKKSQRYLIKQILKWGDTLNLLSSNAIHFIGIFFQMLLVFISPIYCIIKSLEVANVGSAL